MAGHLDGEMAPVRVQDVEGVVVDVRFPDLDILDLALGRPPHIPNRRHGSRHQNQKHPMHRGVLAEVLLGDAVLLFLRAAIHDGNAVGLGERSHAATEAPCHSHPVAVVQFFFGAVVHSPPPTAKATGRIAEPEIGIQHDAVHTLVAAVEKLAVVTTQLICGPSGGAYRRRLFNFNSAPPPDSGFLGFRLPTAP